MVAKREEFELKLEWCQRLVETCLAGRSAFPKKWGEKPIPEDEQLFGREDLGDLLNALRRYSPWLQGHGDEFRSLFGDKLDWYPVDELGRRLENQKPNDPRIASWKMVDSERKYRLRLGKEALSGAVWCCILRLHVHPIIQTSTREAVDTWWPIAEALGKTTAIRKYIGLAGAKRPEWEEDPERGDDDQPVQQPHPKSEVAAAKI